jgi:hypothetical protein
LTCHEGSKTHASFIAMQYSFVFTPFFGFSAASGEERLDASFGARRPKKVGLAKKLCSLFFNQLSCR